MIKRSITAVVVALAGLLAGGARSVAQDNQRVHLAPESQPLRAARQTPHAARTRVSVAFTRVPLQDAIAEIARQAGLSISYRSELPHFDRQITFQASGVPAAAALLDVLRTSRLELPVAQHGRTLIVRERSVGPEAICAVGGSVRAAESGRPLATVEIRLSTSAARTLTGADGAFCFPRVPAGTYTLEAGLLGYATARIAGIVVPGEAAQQISITLTIAAIALADVVVTPGHFGIAHESADRQQTLRREQIETLPQLAEDIYRAVNRLPGVASNELSARLNVRGGNDESMLVRLDGLELLEPFHLKDFDGALSILDVAAIGGVDLVTGGFSAEYGNRLTGVFDLSTTNQLYSRPRTSLGLSISNARFMSQGSFAGGDGLWLLSARRGYLDILLRLIGESDNINPRYYDLLGKVVHQLSPKHRVSAHILRASDRVHLLDDEDVEEEHAFVLDSRYSSTYGWLSWQADFGERLRATTVLSAGALDWHRRGSEHGASGPGCFICDGNDDFDVRDTRSLQLFALRQDWRAALTQNYALKWGFELERGSAEYDYFKRVAADRVVDGQVSERQDTSEVVASPAGTRLGVYLAQRIRPWQPLTLETGLRWDRQSHTDQSQLSPRINLALALGERTTVRAAWGRYTQPHALHQLQVQDGDVTFYGAERAVQIVAGVERRFANGISARVEAYRRNESDLRPRYRNLNNVIGPVAEVEGDRRRFDPASTRAQGIELFLQRQGARSSWSASYALARAYEQIDDLQADRPLDQRHTLYLDYSIAPAPAWRLSASWQYHSGWPITGSTFRADTLANGDTYIVRDYGRYNAERLEPYHRMDLRVTRSFELRRGRLSLFLDVFNLYDRENPQSYNYDVMFRTEGLSWRRHRDPLLPRLPTIGATWEF
jgi:outer membrane cobalamin receptor